MQLVFVVGMPRSGTTLLQSLLGGHQTVFTIPETHFFNEIPSDRILLKNLGIVSRRSYNYYQELLTKLDVNNKSRWSPQLPIFVRQYVDKFIGLLKNRAPEGTSHIVEKTPRHLYRIQAIKHYLDDPQFLHVIRSGEDVIASYYHATNTYPEDWGGSETLENAISRWKNDTSITARWVSEKNHQVVDYDALVENPDSVLRNIFQYLSLTYTESILEDFNETYRELAQDEPWKQNDRSSIRASSSKFDEVLNSEQQKKVLEETEEWLKQIELRK
ncbi:MAG: sulfotransferase [bacterium]